MCVKRAENGRKMSGASKGIPGHAKCVTEIFRKGEAKIRKSGTKCRPTFVVSRENEHTERRKQTNNCVDVYF